MRQRRNAIIGALVWWFGTRWLRKRAARAVSALPGVEGGGRGRSRAVLGALAGLGVLVGGLVAWRKLRGPREPNYPSAARAEDPPAAA